MTGKPTGDLLSDRFKAPAEPRPFEVGMLVLAPLGDPPRTVLWTVTAVRKKSATMVAHLGYGSVTVTTTTVTLPNDWYSLTNDEVIEALAA